MLIFDPADTLASTLTADQLAMVQAALAAQQVLFIQGLPANEKPAVMAEICYQHAKRNRRTLVIARSAQSVDYVLRAVAQHPQIRAIRTGGSSRHQGKVPPFAVDRVVSTWLRRTAALCQQDLTAFCQEQAAAEQVRLELPELIEQQTRLQLACRTVTAQITQYTAQGRELARLERELQRDNVLAEQARLLTGQAVNPPAKAAGDIQLDSLQTARRETETVMAHLQAEREEIVQQLNAWAEWTAWLKQTEKLRAAVLERETELQSLETEKQRLVKCLSQLTAHKPQEPVFLGNKREEQTSLISQYSQYLLEFVQVAQRIQRQDYAPANPFLGQDITLLLARTDILKQRQADLKATEAEKLAELHELSRVLTDTANDYGWTTSLLKPDTQGVVATYHNISCLRNEANDLLWTPPPGILARLGFNSQWKKALLALISRAKAMEQLAAIPGSLREQTITEIDNLLLECRYLTHRVYEACYKHLLACGNALDRSCHRIQDELAAAISAVEKLNRQDRISQSPAGVHAENRELDLRRNLAKVEGKLQQAQSELKRLETAALERQPLAPAAGGVVTAGPAQHQALSGLAGELAEAEQRLQAQTGKLAETSRQLAELQAMAALAQNKLAELKREEQAVTGTITASNATLAAWESRSAAAGVKTALATEWLKRMQEISPAESCELTRRYIAEANVAGLCLAEADLPLFTHLPPVWDVIITDEVRGETVPALLLPVCRGRKTILVG